MNGINYLVDTNCFIYLLEENPLIIPFTNNGWAYSFITEIELLSHKSSQKKVCFQPVIRSSTINTSQNFRLSSEEPAPLKSLTQLSVLATAYSG